MYLSGPAKSCQDGARAAKAIWIHAQIQQPESLDQICPNFYGIVVNCQFTVVVIQRPWRIKRVKIQHPLYFSSECILWLLSWQKYQLPILFKLRWHHLHHYHYPGLASRLDLSLPCFSFCPPAGSSQLTTRTILFKHWANSGLLKTLQWFTSQSELKAKAKNGLKGKYIICGSLTSASTSLTSVT